MLLAEEISRLVHGVHPDPHMLLGPHADGGDLVVRVFSPGATGIAVLLDGADGAVEGARLHSAGIFEARFSGLAALASEKGARYTLEITGTDRGLTRRLDAYAMSVTLGDIDLHLFSEGKHWRIHERLGAHVRRHDGAMGTSFAVWAPNALGVAVVADFNDWSPQSHMMRRLGATGAAQGAGIWEIFVPGVDEGARYKFHIHTRRGEIDKSDPFGRAMELRPETASVVSVSRHVWRDAAFLATRARRKLTRRAMSIYEVHLPSWRRREDRWLTYRELADELVAYVVETGFTHIELLPVMEHPYDGSWGYQVSGYFAPTRRLGSVDDFKYFVDKCHQANIGVLLDWVPAHFPRDASALGRFDGTPIFEHWDPRRGEHRQWETFVFDWGKPEVKNFLIANALYWIEEFHLDGLRVDAVASMLYLDYGANDPSEWEPNIHGGRENLEAVAFLRELNDRIHDTDPGVVVSAEESTSWPGVTRPTYAGGLGFDIKWNMGWMHDTLSYFAQDPIFRAFSHNLITFASMYAYSERFLLPLSHDEVVHLKRSLLSKMPGDLWQMRATLRALYGLMWAQPGRKLLFMGGEIGQTTEWNFATELEWKLLEHPGHAGIQKLVGDLNRMYRETPALHELDDEPAGFHWIDANDARQSVASFVRYPASKLKARRTGEHVIFVGNFTPVVRHGYRVGVPRACNYREAINPDAIAYGGSNVGNLGVVRVDETPSHGFDQSIVLTVPPLAVVYLVPVDADEPTEEELAAEDARRSSSREKESAEVS